MMDRFFPKRSTRRGVAWLVLAAAAAGSLAVLIKGAVAAGLNDETAMTLAPSSPSSAWSSPSCSWGTDRVSRRLWEAG